MKIESIEFKNFASYGNKVQTIEFDPESPAFFLVVGGNGFGKTTISDAIKFGIYGKLEHKKMKDIPNRINGAAWVRIKMKVKNKVVIIERGLDPGILKLTVDNIPYDKANKKGPNEYLIEELLELPYQVFSNIVSISINDFKSFLKMSAPDKRLIVDKIFGFQIINQMRELLKDQMKGIKESLDTVTGKMSSLQRSLSSSLDELDSLTKKLQDNTDGKLKDAKEGLDKYKKLLTLHSDKMSEFSLKERELRDGLNKYIALLSATRSQITDIERKLKLYDKNKCHECGSNLDTEFHLDVKKSMIEQLDNAKSDFDINDAAYKDMKGREAIIDVEKRSLMEKGSKIQMLINNNLSDIRSLESGTKNDEQLASIKNIIDRMQQDTNEAKGEKMKNEERINWIKILDDVLGDKGVKQLAIKTILPSLNAEIYQLMNKMHLDYRVIFDEEFGATITHLGVEINVATLSRGEMKKVDFVVLLSIIKLMKMKFPSINLLFLDEIFDGVDPDGIYAILKILGKSSKDLGLNTFVISHQMIPTEGFDYRIEVEKKNNFSNLRIEKS